MPYNETRSSEDGTTHSVRHHDLLYRNSHWDWGCKKSRFFVTLQSETEHKVPQFMKKDFLGLRFITVYKNNKIHQFHKWGRANSI